MTEADLVGGLRLSRASGWNQTLPDWRLLLSLGPGLFHVGVDETRVVASGGAVRYGDDLAWICMILVDPDSRGRGLGTQVFDAVLEGVRRLVDTGRLRSVGLDATPAGRGIYVQRGFVDGPALVRMSREAGRRPGPPRAGESSVRRMRPADLEAVLTLDRVAFGADRAALLQHALASAPDLARIAHDGPRLRGFCLGRHGEHSDHAGPVVAEDGETACDLVAGCLAELRVRPLLVDARVEPSWTAALEAMGFREQRPFTRMYLGGARPPARPQLEHAVRGPEFG